MCISFSQTKNLNCNGLAASPRDRSLDYEQVTCLGQCQEFEETIGEKERKVFNRLFKTHSRAIYHSRLLDFPFLPEPQNSKEVNEIFYKLTSNLIVDSPTELSKEWVRSSNNLQIQEDQSKAEKIDLAIKDKRVLSISSSVSLLSKEINMPKIGEEKNWKTKQKD